ncbi:MAG: hypothetical protein K0S74_796 [Chlamydiales bacterium]|jgi:hypothetical protein|nr:hypothetical protein [Chlamydiales bacterium]
MNHISSQTLHTLGRIGVISLEIGTTACAAAFIGSTTSVGISIISDLGSQSKKKTLRDIHVKSSSPTNEIVGTTINGIIATAFYLLEKSFLAIAGAAAGFLVGTTAGIGYQVYKYLKK